MLSKFTYLSIMIIVLNTELAKGQTDSVTFSRSLIELVITGNYKPTGIDKSVLPTRNITLEKLAPLGLQNVADVLKYQANIRIQQDPLLGSGMSMQGISGENVKILIDGVPVIGRQNGNIDLSQLNIYNVERIEVVEGPLSVQYGTNALAGTINIITKKTPKKTLDFQGSTYFESAGHFNANGMIGWRGDDQSVMVSGGRNFFNGWSTIDTSRFKEWKPKIQYFSDLVYNIKLGKASLRYSGSYFNEYILNRGRPLSPYFEKAFDDHFNTTRLSNSVNFSYPFKNDLKTNLIFAFNDFKRVKNTYYKDLINVSEVLTANPSDQDTTQFKLVSARGTLAKTDNKKLNFETGFDINVENANSQRIKQQRQSIGDYAAFVSAEWAITEGVTLRPGLRVSHNTTYKAPLVPSLHLKWKLNNEWTARASYGKGFRAPSLKELYFYFVDINHNIRGNENLLAENSHNLNSVFTYKKVKDKKVFKFEGSAFYNDIRNLITLAVLSGKQNEFGYINIGKYKTLGGQAFAEYVVNNFSIGTGLGYTNRTNVIDDKKFEAGSWEGRSNITYSLPQYDLDFNLWYKYSGRQAGFVLDESGLVQPTFLASYQIADFGFSKKIFKKKLAISSGIKNLFNVKNIDSQLVSGAHSASNGLSSLGTGRNFYIKCEIFL
jgi:outer membrane receptor for ferrienterochelin and colicins